MYAITVLVAWNASGVIVYCEAVLTPERRYFASTGAVALCFIGTIIAVSHAIAVIRFVNAVAPPLRQITCRVSLEHRCRHALELIGWTRVVTVAFVALVATVDVLVALVRLGYAHVSVCCAFP